MKYYFVGYFVYWLLKETKNGDVFILLVENDSCTMDLIETIMKHFHNPFHCKHQLAKELSVCPEVKKESG
jgi:hypothetical protein